MLLIITPNTTAQDSYISIISFYDVTCMQHNFFFDNIEQFSMLGQDQTFLKAKQLS